MFIIWGTGIKGNAILEFLGSHRVEAFIESKAELVGKEYCGIPIISFESYLKYYTDKFIIISPISYQEIVDTIEKAGVFQYFVLRDCPSELSRYIVPDILQRLATKYSSSDRIAIYGINLFSLLLYEVLIKKGCKTLYLVPHKRLNINTLRVLTRIYPWIHVAYLIEIEKLIDKVLITVEYDLPLILQEKRADYKTINTSDFSKCLPEYYNPLMGKFKNIHTGLRCFIVATGPSLRIEDLDCLYLNNELCISMNRIYCSFNKTNWRPDYYVVEDLKLLNSYEEDIKKLDIKYKFITDDYQPYWKKGNIDQSYKYHKHYTPVLPDKPKFSEDLTYRIYGGYTVTYLCIQLAVYMGFKEIYLLGVDFNYTGDTSRENNHFVHGYSKEGESNAFFLKEGLMSYEVAKEYSEKNGIKIYNATRGGKLEVFERVDFNDLF